MGEERIIVENIKGFCRMRNIQDRLYGIADDLHGLEEELAIHAEKLFLDKLCNENPPRDGIRAVLKCIDSQSNRGFDQDDLDNLKDLVKGRVPDDHIEAV